MEKRYDVYALKGLECDGDVIIKGDFYAIGKVSCRTLRVEGNFYLYGGNLYSQELYVDGNMYVDGNIYMERENATTLTRCTAKVGGDVICNGRIKANCGKMTVIGSFVTKSSAYLGATRLNVSENIETQYLYCGGLSACGDIDANGRVDVRGEFYALGNIFAWDIVLNRQNIYCGGTCTANRYSVGKVFEDVKNWRSLN